MQHADIRREEFDLACCIVRLGSTFMSSNVKPEYWFNNDDLPMQLRVRLRS